MLYQPKIKRKALLLKVIRTFPGRKIDDYAFKLNVSRNTIGTYIKELKTLGKIERKGDCRYGGYYVV